MLKGLPIKLDSALPFVKAVQAISGTDDSLDPAVDALIAAEERAGVGVWSEPAGRSHLGAGVFVLNDEDEPVSIAELMSLLTDYKRFHAVYRPAAENADDRLIDSSLMPFLSDTQLVIQGKDFTNDHFIRFADGTISAWTQRTWGELLTEWAVMTEWGLHFDEKGRPVQWQPADFHHDLDDDVIEGYGRWQELVRRVIRRKTDRLVGVTAVADDVS